MRRKSLLPKTLAVFLSLIFSLPNPAWALRQSGLEESKAKGSFLDEIGHSAPAAGAEEKGEGKKKKVERAQPVDLMDFLEEIKPAAGKGGDAVRFFDGREGPFARVPPEGVQFSWLNMIGDREVGGLRLFTGGKAGGDWFLRVSSQAVGELKRVYIRLHQKEDPDTWKPVGTVAAEGAPGPVEYGGIILELIPGGREVLIRPSGDEPVYLADNLLLKKAVSSAAGAEEMMERMDGYRSAIETPGIVVIGRELAQRFMGLQVLAGMDDKVIIDRNLPETMVRLAERGITDVIYFGGREEAREFSEAAQVMRIGVTPHTPENPTFLFLLREILAGLGIPEGISAAGVEEFANGLEQLAEAA